MMRKQNFSKGGGLLVSTKEEAYERKRAGWCLRWGVLQHPIVALGYAAGSN